MDWLQMEQVARAFGSFGEADAAQLEADLRMTPQERIAWVLEACGTGLSRCGSATICASLSNYPIRTAVMVSSWAHYWCDLSFAAVLASLCSFGFANSGLIPRGVQPNGNDLITRFQA